MFEEQESSKTWKMGSEDEAVVLKRVNISVSTVSIRFYYFINIRLWVCVVYTTNDWHGSRCRVTCILLSVCSVCGPSRCTAVKHFSSKKKNMIIIFLFFNPPTFFLIISLLLSKWLLTKNFTGSPFYHNFNVNDLRSYNSKIIFYII